MVNSTGHAYRGTGKTKHSIDKILLALQARFLVSMNLRLGYAHAPLAKHAQNVNIHLTENTEPKSMQRF